MRPHNPTAASIVLMVAMMCASSACAIEPLSSLSKADAIKRFKAADKDGNCKISEEELMSFAIEKYIDPVALIGGYTLSGSSNTQVRVHFIA